MPVHEWSRVSAGIFHDFHVAWTIELRNALNERILPAEYYAMAEQFAGPFGPDVLTLQATAGEDDEPPPGSTGSEATGPIAVAESPPRVRFTAVAEHDAYLAKQRSVVMPLFLEPGFYVNVPLEATYLAAWRGMPKRWQRVLEA
ncbi:MAG TPA: hypothetical protein VFW87_25210 [Pirellulales bacterium]|nr:hypothetical protein [Pirellulales bacterium]